MMPVKSVGMVKAVAVRILNKTTTSIVSFGFQKNRKILLKRYGTNYGGYWLPDVFAQAQGSLISVGLGRDISFDLCLLNLGYEVVGCDPDTRFSRDILSKTHQRSFKLFEKMLVASPQDVSQIDLRNLCAESNLIYPRLLKCDIEGTELSIIDTLSNLQFNFDWLAFEIDYLSCLKFKELLKRARRILEVRTRLKTLDKMGFDIIMIDGFNFHWVNRNSIESRI